MWNGRYYLPILGLMRARRAVAQVGGGQTASTESSRTSLRPFVLVVVSSLEAPAVGCSVTGPAAQSSTA
jgi:hypothetical protein